MTVASGEYSHCVYLHGICCFLYQSIGVTFTSSSLYFYPKVKIWYFSMWIEAQFILILHERYISMPLVFQQYADGISGVFHDQSQV